jgi:hypothetical protein
MVRWSTAWTGLERPQYFKVYFLHAVLQASLDQVSYEVEEGITLDFCIVVDGNTAFSGLLLGVVVSTDFSTTADTSGIFLTHPQTPELHY